MDIPWDIPDCALVDFLKLFWQLPLSALFRSLFFLLLLILRCFLVEDLPSLDPCQDVSSLLWSLEISQNSCRVCQRSSNPVLPRPANVTAETLTGFGLIGFDFEYIRYGSTSIRWLEAPSISLLFTLVLAQKLTYQFVGHYLERWWNLVGIPPSEEY